MKAERNVWNQISGTVVSYRRRAVGRTQTSDGLTQNNVYRTARHLSSSNHRLRGSASPVLTATHHSYGSPRLSDFFSGSRLEVRPPNRFWRKMAQTTWIHARMILL